MFEDRAGPSTLDSGFEIGGGGGGAMAIWCNLGVIIVIPAP